MIDPLSEQELDLLRRVYARRHWGQNLLGNDDRLEALHQLEASHKVAAIFQLLHLVNSSEEKIAQAAVHAMHRLFQELRPADFPSFDEGIRRQSWSSWNPGGYTVVKIPQAIRTLVRSGGDYFFLAGLFSCHADGYTREAAVRALGTCDTGEELPFLLLRIGDWVEDVRNTAKELLEPRIREQYAPHFVAYLPLVLRLQRARRQNHDAILGRIQKLLATPNALSSIEEGMRSPDGAARRFCYGIALSTEDPQKLATVARRALKENNLRISLDGLRAIARVGASSELKEVVDVAREKLVASVRLAALRVVLETYSESADAECRKGLLDRNSGVRQQAQFYLQKSAALDVCKHYRELLSVATLRELPNVVAGIGEVCSKPQAALLEPYLCSARSLVRLCAYRAIAQLDPSHPVDNFLKGLQDESLRVMRVAALFLRKRVNLIGGERIWEIHQQLANPRHRRWTLFLVAGLTKWDSCYFLIRGLNDIDAEVSMLARGYLERWVARYNKSFVAPRREQREKLDLLIAENQHMLTSSELLLFNRVLKAS